MTTGYDRAKRILDVTVAAAVLMAGAPVAAFCAWRIKREDGGPILYRGERVGLGGRPFKMLKFRSMVVDAARLGGPSTADDDPRLTLTGRMLRRWKLDELPQFLNVLGGSMSLVGPRPQVPSDVARYTERERRLLEVKPGITDWASIVFRDEGGILAGHGDPDLAYDLLIRPRKIELGLAYVADHRLRVDLEILVLTVLAVLGVRGVDEYLLRVLPTEPVNA
ncbi:sugar transferase [Actinoplanes sp. CA-030573]|uniref:sugar transferase n=1 Tax=Actinoplanes sp. CA-030573 TaxID=3239898 RepID=UPI003D8EE855